MGIPVRFANRQVSRPTLSTGLLVTPATRTVQRIPLELTTAASGYSSDLGTSTESRTTSTQNTKRHISQNLHSWQFPAIHTLYPPLSSLSLRPPLRRPHPDQMQAKPTGYHSLRPDVRKPEHPQFVRSYLTEERRNAATRTRLTRAQRRLANAKSRMPDHS